MRRSSPLSRGSLVLGLLSLALGLAPLLPLAPAARADEARISLEAKWLVLRKEDVHPQMVQIPDRVSTDGRGQLTVRQFDPNLRNLEFHPPVPSLTIDKLWIANDTPTAQQIFQEQVNAGFPEARVTVNNAGGIELPPLGHEARGSGGCGPCDSGVVHYRIVFRYLNAIHALYVFGSDQYAYQGVAVNWATILNERIRAVPPGPPPDVFHAVTARAVALSIGEMGKEIDHLGEQEGTDAGGQWYQTRFKRLKERERSHIGPLDIYNKVWVAPDLDTARQIYAEQASPGLPEAHEGFIGEFPMRNPPGWGNDNFGWSACNDDCNTQFFRYLHHRYVLRSGNVVIVLYTWGGAQDTSVEQVSVFAQAMRNRIP